MGEDNKNYYSNGKLLLSGEYAVLDGATAFAVPVNLGQNLEVRNATNPNTLNWEAFVINKLWFSANFEIDTLKIKKTNNQLIAERLRKILLAVLKLKPNFKNNLSSHIITNLNFNRDWGLGSSSTLISNIAYWSDINPFELFHTIYDGSGYDIASARISKPFLYTSKKDINPIIEEVNFENEFLDSIFFVHLGKKQNSNLEIDSYRKQNKLTSNQISEISSISTLFAQCKTLKEFQSLMFNHEQIISKIINKPSVKTELFSDFDGSIKSLGAWGGDFIMAVSQNDSNYVKDYFSNKKLNAIFNYKHLAIK